MSRAPFTVEDASGLSKSTQRVRIENALARAREMVRLEEARLTCVCGARRWAHEDGGGCDEFRPRER